MTMTKQEVKKLLRGDCLLLDDGNIVAFSHISGTGWVVVGWPAMGGICPIKSKEIVQVLDVNSLDGENKRAYDTSMWSIERYG